MSWRRKRSKGSFINPVEGASVINRGGGGGPKPMRKKAVNVKQNRELSDAPKECRGWETIRWEDMTPGMREELCRPITPGNEFKPGGIGGGHVDMSDLDAERDSIMKGCQPKEIYDDRESRETEAERKRMLWREKGLARARRKMETGR